VEHTVEAGRCKVRPAGQEVVGAARDEERYVAGGGQHGDLQALSVGQLHCVPPDPAGRASGRPFLPGPGLGMQSVSRDQDAVHAEEIGTYAVKELPSRSNA
ncbi:hypothetical protein BZG21_35130, partial [Escherichia coli]|nr:hypothetical protein [Escherichia coli]